MPQRQGDANNSSCLGAGDQIEIRSNRAIEVLFQFRQEGCRKRAENAAPVNTQEAALPLPRPFVFSYQRRLLMSGPAGSALVIRDRPNDPLRTAPASGRYRFAGSRLRFVLPPANAPTLRPQLPGSSAHLANGRTVVGSLRRPGVSPHIDVPARVRHHIYTRFVIRSVNGNF